MLDLGQLRVVLDERLKDIHGQRYQDDLQGRVYGHTTAHGSKNTLSEFMDLSDKLQVYRPKMHFWNLWTYTFKVYGPSDTNYKLMDLKNARVCGTK